MKVDSKSLPPARPPRRFAPRTALLMLAAAALALLSGGATRAELPVPLPPGQWVSSGVVDPLPGGYDPSRDIALDIYQRSERAILNWRSFNVGRDNSVTFHQPGSGSVALNRIHQQSPSRILGAINANGQVYLVNPNGILFGAGAQVNVGGLVASTLDVPTDLFENGGITDAANQRRAALEGDGRAFVLDADGQVVTFAVDSAGEILRRDDGEPIPLADARAEGLVPEDAVGEPMAVRVLVDAGGVLRTGDGGRVLLVAPEVVNRGRVEAPGGQVVMAGAYDRVYLAPSADDDLRGLLVEVDTGGRIDNLGEIVARRGNISLAALAVNQDGLARATTTVDLNGSVRILSRHKASVANITGPEGQRTLTPAPSSVPADDDPLQDYGARFGEGSRTEVVPDPGDQRTAIDEQPQPRSRIEAAGQTVRLEARAALLAPGGDVVLQGRQGGPVAGEVVLAPGSRIDVSGTDSVVLPMSRNLGEIELRGNELADFPVQRDGVLQGKTVRFDLRRPPRIGNVQAAYDGIQRGVAERLATGGSVAVRSDRFALEGDALIDISGGVVTYQSGALATTQLASHGQVVEFSDADPSRVYDAVLGEVVREHPKWGPAATQRWTGFGPAAYARARREPGYREGKDAGSLEIVASEIDLSGRLAAGVSAGRLQRRPPSEPAGRAPRPFDQIPAAGRLAIGELIVNGTALSVQGPEHLTLGDGDPGRPGESTIAADVLTRTGLGSLDLVATGGIRMLPGFDAALPPAGRLRLRSPGDIEIAGTVRVPSGTVTVETVSVSEARPSLVLAATARIDAQGTWVNDRPVGSRPPTRVPLAIDGGRVSLGAAGDLTLEAGSVVDVGGGARLTATGDIEAGAPGRIDLSAVPALEGGTEARLSVDGALRGLGLREGGALKMRGPGFLVGASPDPGTDPRLGLDAGFFARGGFSHFELEAVSSSLDSAGRVLAEVAAGTTVDLAARNLVLRDGAGAAPSGADIEALTLVTRLPADRRQPTTLSIGSERRIGLGSATSIAIGAGARIATEIGGELTLRASDRILVAGSLIAPAGRIEARIEDPGNETSFGTQGIWLADSARLSAAGAGRVVTDARGRRNGEILPGGLVRVDAERGYVVAAPGSVIDVAGTAGALDLAVRDSSGRQRIERSTVASAAGRIALRASEGLLLYGALNGQAGGAQAAGGTLAVALDISERAGNAQLLGDGRFPETARVLGVGQRRDYDAAWFDFGAEPFEQAFRTSALDEAGRVDPAGGLNGLGVLDPAQVGAGGFGAVDLRARQSFALRADRSRFSVLPAEIRFLGDQSLTAARRITLDAPIIAGEGGMASVAAPYVGAGSTNDAFPVSQDFEENVFSATTGDARLRIEADVIDLIGSTALRGFASAGAAGDPLQAPVLLDARSDLRLRGVAVPPRDNAGFPELRGVLRVASDLTLRAGQVYPTTLSEFAVDRFDPAHPEDRTGVLHVLGNGRTGPAPLSAGGRVSLSAPRIVQQGTLRAPQGSLAFGRFRRDPDGVRLRDPQSGEPLLDPAESVALAQGSLTSVAADGRIVPFGALVLESNWVYEVNGILRGMDEPRIRSSAEDPDEVAGRERDRPWTKQIDIAAKAIDLDDGASFDLSGDGDILAAEFRPGTRGSRDLLAASEPTAFAIIPSQALTREPADPLLAYDDLLASELAPELPREDVSRAGLTVQIGAGSEVPPGEYLVLPRGYAILPGAYLLTPLDGSAGFVPGDRVIGPDGVTTVGVRFATVDGAATQGRWSAARVENRAQLLDRAEYLIETGSAFFARRAADRDEPAPQLPRDAGRLVLEAGSALRLGASIVPARGDGRGSQVDILADDMALVTALSGATDRVELAAAELETLGADSLLIGGRRSVRAGVTEVAVGARAITVEEATRLANPELLLVAREELRVRAGASLAAAGGSGPAAVLAFGAADTPRALLRLSSAEQVDLVGNASPGGLVTVEQGASLSATGSITLDASTDVILDGTLTTAEGSIALGASRISLGAAPQGTDGLVLSGLEGLSARELRLASRSTVDLYGPVQGAVDSLLLDAAGLRGLPSSATAAPAAVEVSARRIELRNTGPARAAAPAGGDGGLSLIAGELILGPGEVVIEGMAATALTADRVVARGDTALDVAGGLTLATDLLVAAGGADLRLGVAGGALIESRDGAPGPYGRAESGLLTKRIADGIGLGGRLAIAAGDLSLSTRILAPSGVVGLSARGGDLRLAEGAVVDVAGRMRRYADLVIGTGGGEVSLGADAGRVLLEAGARVDVGGTVVPGPQGMRGGEAGTLRLASPAGALAAPAEDVLLGSLWASGGDDMLVALNPVRIDSAQTTALDALAAQAIVAGVELETADLLAIGQRFDGGRLEVDAAALAPGGFAALGSSAIAGGFGREQRLRLRTGDLLVEGEVRAHRLSLTADAGGVTVTGRVDATGAAAGMVEIAAGGDLVVAGSARVRAGARGEGERGGELRLSSRAGEVVLAATDEPGAMSIDLSGGTGAEETGLLRITAARTRDAAGLRVAPIEAAIAGAGRVEAVGHAVYEDVTRIDAALIGDAGDAAGESVRGDTAAFMASVTAEGVAARLDPDGRLGPRLHVVPGNELRADGDLELADAWDLSGWRDGGEWGVLTLRAGGSLTIAQDLSDGLRSRNNLRAITNFEFVADASQSAFALVDTLLDDGSWSLDLVAGADLSSADLLATRSAADLVLADGARVRTGTGAIALAAGGDVRYEGRGAAIYTMGRNAGFGGIAFDPAEWEALGDDLAQTFAYQQSVGYDYGPDLVAPKDLATAPFFFDTYLPGAVFAEGGGDLRARIGGDLVGPGSDQLFGEWLVTLGGPTVPAQSGTVLGAEVPAMWAVRPDAFRQNLGTLGGGDVAVEVGGDVTDLSVVVATTGQPQAGGFAYAPVSQQFTASGDHLVQQLGGGDLSLRIGGDLRGGTVLLARGDGAVAARGTIGAPRAGGPSPILALGNAQLGMTAGAGAAIETAFDFGMLGRAPLSRPDGPALGQDTVAFYFTYGQGSALAVDALAGDVLLRNATRSTDPIFRDLLGRNDLSGESKALTVYPGSFAARALGGDLLIRRELSTYPDPTGTLELLADGDISDLGEQENNAELPIVQSDADPRLLPRPVAPVTAAPAIVTAAFTPSKLLGITPSQRLPHAAAPVHRGDMRPSRLVAREGGIGKLRAGSRGIRLFTAEQTLVSAGRDIVNLDLEIQNVDPEHASLVEAGRDIRFEPNRDAFGALVQSGEQGLLFAGPGSGAVVAGRDLDLGTSDGIVSIGNLRNPALAPNGADLAVIAGQGGPADYAGLIEAILRDPAPLPGPYQVSIDLRNGDGSDFDAPRAEALAQRFDAIAGVDFEIKRAQGAVPDLTGASVRYDLRVDSQQALDRFNTALGGDDSLVVGTRDLLQLGRYEEGARSYLAERFDIEVAAGEGLDRLAALDTRLSRDFLLDAWFNELQVAGVTAQLGGSGDFGRGFRAVDTLFPDAPGRAGDLRLLLSRIHTEDGGDVRVLVPGGGANAGAASLEGLSKDENQLGIVVQQRGNLSAFVRDDLLVNASRVFALQGGDILLWSSRGDIDAGRGAKTALAAPPPTVVFDPESEQFVTVFPPEIRGSGIRNFAPAGVAPGDVLLFAPRGTINAGDAGIGSAGNVTVGAVEVIGADNIDIGGTSFGVPTAPASIAAGLTSVGDVTGEATSQAQEVASSQAVEDVAESEAAVGLLSVDVLCFGDEACEAYD